MVGQMGSVYKQPETEVDDLSQLGGCQVSTVEGDTKGRQRGTSKGEQKARGIVPCM